MFIDSNLVTNLTVFETLKDIVLCSICTGVLVEPQQCISCDCCFCKKCLNEWLAKSKICPLKCENVNFKDSRLMKQMLSRLTFKCPFDCPLTLSYEEILTHEDVCDNLTAECPTCKTVVSKSKIRINEYEKTIKALREEVEMWKKKCHMSVKETYDIPSLFNNSRKVFETLGGNFLRTISSNNVLSEIFCINIKFIKLSHPGHMVIGVSDRIINENRGYLGGDLGMGNWGIAGNGALGEEGVWMRTSGYKQGDVLTIRGRGSQISYMINYKPNNYIYDLKKRPLYFSISYYHENEILELVIP